MKGKILVVSIFCLFSVGLVSADEILVEPGTNTISAALFNTYPGDVLLLEAGTYIETNTLNTTPYKITIRGVWGQTVYQTSRSDNLTEFDNDKDHESTAAILVKGDFRIENIIFKTDSVGRCIVNAFGSVTPGQEHAADKNSIFIDHCEFHNWTETPVWIPDPEVMFDSKAHPVDTLSVTNCLFYNGRYQSIRGEYQQTRVAIIKNCTFWNNYRENIKIYGHKEIPDYMRYLVDHCTFYGAKKLEDKIHTSNHGVYFKYTSAGDTIRNCIMYKLAGYGITGKEGDFTKMTIQNCIAFDCGVGNYHSNVSNIGQLLFQEDPLFNDPDNGDFSLKEGSLAKGTATDGTDLGNPITDWTLVLTVVEARKLSTEPAAFALKQNYPNPFNPWTTITYSVEKPELVTLDIYTITGQKIRKLVNKVQAQGSHSVEWNGLDDHGRSVSGGVYLYRLKAGSDLITKKMVYVD